MTLCLNTCCYIFQGIPDHLQALVPHVNLKLTIQPNHASQTVHVAGHFPLTLPYFLRFISQAAMYATRIPSLRKVLSVPNAVMGSSIATATGCRYSRFPCTPCKGLSTRLFSFKPRSQLEIFQTAKNAPSIKRT